MRSAAGDWTNDEAPQRTRCGASACLDLILQADQGMITPDVAALTSDWFAPLPVCSAEARSATKVPFG